jgi:ABC-type multidrug transport system fused ATPase/permease subunit
VHTLLTYSITLILLVILQTNTIHLTLQGLIALVTVHNYLSIGVIGMNSKISSLVRSDTVRRGISARSVREHVRDDRRMMCLVLHAVLSFVIVVDIWWIGSLVDDRQVEASSFRSTGINLFVHRALDLQYTLIMTLAVPIALFIANELHFKFNNNRMQVEQERRRRAKAQGSEEDEESKGNGARDSDISEDNEEDEENEDDFDTDEDEHDEDQ